MVKHFERDFTDVLHVYVLVDHDDALGEHGLTHRPDSVHDFARLPGIRLADRDQHKVVKHAFNRKVDVDKLRNGESHQRQENSLDRFAHPAVFHRRLAHDGGRIDRSLAVSNAGKMKHRIKIFERVETGVIAKRTFAAQFVEMNVALKHYL